MNDALLTDGARIEEWARRIEAAPRDAAIAWDTETNAIPGSPLPKPELAVFGGAYAAGVSFCLVEPQDAAEGRIEGFYVPMAHRSGNAPQEAVQRLLRALESTQAMALEHHGTFDRWAIRPIGPQPTQRRIDTQVASWLEDENRRRGLKYLGSVLVNEDADAEANALKELRKAPYGKLKEARAAVMAAFPEYGKVLKNGTRSAKTIGPDGDRFARQLVRARSWSDLTVAEIATYAARDASLTYEVAHALLGGHDGILRPSGPLQREMALQPILVDMTIKGVGVDIEAFRRAESLYQQRADGIAAQIDAAFGDRYRKRFGSKAHMNLGSDKQMEWLVFDELGLTSYVRTDSGGRSTAKDALAMHTHHEVVRSILEHRRWQHAVDSYAVPFRMYAEASADERIHGQFGSDKTVTGRLACSSPNMMTIPKDNTLPEIREAMMRVDPGYRRVGFDLKSAELWVTASITRDAKLTETLFENGSMHLDMMEEVWGFRDKEHQLYTIAKNVNYSMAYEAGVNPVRLYCAAGGIPYEESTDIAYRILRAHKRLYRGMHSMSAALTEIAREKGKLPLHVPGRYRHFRSPGHFVEYYTALNALVQGGIGELMKDTMLNLGDLLPFLVLQVHDELVFDLPLAVDPENVRRHLVRIINDVRPANWLPLDWDFHVWTKDEAA